MGYIPLSHLQYIGKLYLNDTQTKRRKTKRRKTKRRKTKRRKGQNVENVKTLNILINFEIELIYYINNNVMGILKNKF